MRGFSPFNQILVNLFDVSNASHCSILFCLHHLTRVRFNIS